MKLSGEFIPNGDFKSTKKLTWLAKVTDYLAYCLFSYIEFVLVCGKDKDSNQALLSQRVPAETTVDKLGFNVRGMQVAWARGALVVSIRRCIGSVGCAYDGLPTNSGNKKPGVTESIPVVPVSRSFL